MQVLCYPYGRVAKLDKAPGYEPGDFAGSNPAAIINKNEGIMSLTKEEQQEYADTIFSLMQGDTSLSEEVDAMLLHTQDALEEFDSDFVTGFLEFAEAENPYIRIFQSRPDPISSFPSAYDAINVLEIEKDQAKILIKTLKKVFPDLFTT